MKKIFVLLFIFNTGLSQTLKVNYDYTVDMSGTNSKPFLHRMELIHCNGFSLLKKYLTSSMDSQSNDKNGEKSIIVKIGNDTTYVFKNFNENKLYSEEKIFTNVFNVIDSLSIFNWTIEKDSLTFLGYKCNKAKTTFRGREFEVYFTTDIPISDGPAKYNGLPGLILIVKIINSDAIYSIEATELTISEDNILLKNPFLNRNCIPFVDFKKKFFKKLDEIQSFNEGQGTEVVIGKTGIELLKND